MKPITVCSYKTQIIGHIVSDFFLQILEVPLPAFKTDRRRFYEWLKEWDLLWKQCVVSYEGSAIQAGWQQQNSPAAETVRNSAVFWLLISRNDGGLSLDNQLIPEWNCWVFFSLFQTFYYIFICFALCVGFFGKKIGERNRGNVFCLMLFKNV